MTISTICPAKHKGQAEQRTRRPLSRILLICAFRSEGPLPAHFISLSGASRSPYAIEPPRCCACVMRGVPRISVAEIVLDQPQVIAPVGECEAAGMAQHVRVDATEARAEANCADQVID